MRLVQFQIDIVLNVYRLRGGGWRADLFLNGHDASSMAAQSSVAPALRSATPALDFFIFSFTMGTLYTCIQAYTIKV